jgi:hypothetical protein
VKSESYKKDAKIWEGRVEWKEGRNKNDVFRLERQGGLRKVRRCGWRY